MAKIATRYLEVHPWSVAEKGFHPERSEVSESVFSVGNEFMGVRGFFEEGYSGASMLGSFFNGIFEYEDILPKPWPKGPVDTWHYMVNTVNWLHTSIRVGGERLDLATSKFSDFERTLDLKTGLMTRSFVWRLTKGRSIRMEFARFTSMTDAHLGVQRIRITPDFGGTLALELGLDFSILHHMSGKCMWAPVKAKTLKDGDAILAGLPRSGHRVFSSMRVAIDGEAAAVKRGDAGPLVVGKSYLLQLRAGTTCVVDRFAVNLTERAKDVSDADVWERGMSQRAARSKVTYAEAQADSVASWTDAWARSGIEIEGDAEAEQGVRFGVFQLHQTYHGVDPRLNVAAKGLTGENYAGHTLWDTETYCLPFYLFNNPRAARDLLGYRYRTLDGALRRSASDDCVGARYPMSSIDGYEACAWWAHGDLEIHVSAAVGYGIWHYVNVTGDQQFIRDEGLEMLIQICKFYASRGAWSQRTGKFGFFGVMGPDEFHMMVNNNCYTNVLAAKFLRWTLAAIKQMRKSAPAALRKVAARTGLKPSEEKQWAEMAGKMAVPRDERTGLYEQHDGYFDYPHTDVDKIPPEQFPLYKHWSYFRIFRTDMIKQPDVLLLMFFFAGEYGMDEKRSNYDYYERRCSHESSLSPSIHSILAAELGDHAKAFSYWAHAGRLDRDDYNRNTCEELHTTSMAAAWLNVVYGFGGMRSDADRLAFNPSQRGQSRVLTH